ncbi:MAG: response regulator, partial [Acidimicrobiia bacterium]|nr:response regulator [Acidimicrobiia bacterium]
LTQKITVDVKGEILELKNTINVMVDQLSSFADEVTRVAREVGTEGKLGGQAQVEGVSGTWKDLTDSVNFMASNLTGQVRNIAQVTTAVAKGDLTQKITVDVKGEILELKNTINVMVDQLSSFADEVTRVAREVGTEGKLGGQAQVRGVSGTWKDLTDNVNFLASNLTSQVRNIAQVTTAVAKGDLTQKITVEAKGEVAALAETINGMTDQLSSFADEVTRVAREVGTDGKLGGQARVKGVSGTWKDLTDNVNFMAGNLTSQVRSIAQVTTAVAKGDLTKKITVDARGEILELKDTINTMVDQLSSFAAEVTRVAKEVGTEGRLGGQAEVEGVAGTWKRLTENVNQLAATLTTQLRAIAEVSTAVTQGDLTRSITVAAQGEVAELKDNINQMIANLRETTIANQEQDWLKTNLARISGLMQGQRDLQTVSRLIMSELTPVVSAQHGAFYMAQAENTDDAELNLLASYGYKSRKHISNQFKFGEALVGQAALEKKMIVITEAPSDYIKITSGLGESEPVNIIIVPVLFEDQVLAVIELASFRPFSEVHQTFLDQLTETIGVVLSTIIANMRTEELLEQSQRLTRELQSQSEELQTQQEELQQTNEELQEKAALLAEQNRNIEIKNAEIEMARLGLEEKAEQLALSSKYKSEFLANMSHELRTPLNSLLILAKLLSDNQEGNLSDKQIEFAGTIHKAGSDLLELINDILDLSKVEAGKMDITPADLALEDVRQYAAQAFVPVAEQKDLQFETEVVAGTPSPIFTDEQRLQQVVRNLLSNAFKFTERGKVTLRIARPAAGTRFLHDALQDAEHVVAFSVIDTGIGVPEDKLRLIFEAFQQADGTTARRYGGTGLGLSISREIARLLGGEIHAESVVGEGSTFTLYLPTTYRPEQQAGVATTVVESRPEPAKPKGKGKTKARATSKASGQTPAALPEDDLGDDRGSIKPGDRVILVAETDTDLAAQALAAARTRGLKVLAATSRESAHRLAQAFKLDAVILDTDLGTEDGIILLDSLKRHPATRLVPVHVIADAKQRQSALLAGAAGVIEKPVTDETLDLAIGRVADLLARDVKRLLVVEDDDRERDAISELLGGGADVVVSAVATGEEAFEQLAIESFDCVVLDLKLPGTSGFSMLEQLKKDDRFRNLPVIVYTGQELTRRDETRLKKYAQTVIIKTVGSPERLLDEATRFLHRSESALPVEQRRMLEQLHSADAVLDDKKILIVDDDVRNVFALTSALENHGMEVLFAENGRDGIEVLTNNADVDLVLMDIMMPEMDGYEAIAAVRKMRQFKRLPIIALTAKAMREDREKSIAAGASDYIAKPVEIDQLLSLMRVWLHE